jgi:hypothetical protein
MNGMKSRGTVARYLRIGEPVPERVVPTELGPHEEGETGGAVARYLKIERHERPVVAQKASSRPEKKSHAPKAHRPRVRHPRTRVAVELDPADTPRPEISPAPVVEPAKAAPAKARRAKPKRPARAFCPDCEGEIEPGTDQCPHCALFLDKAA